jgi:hypothetical protein
MVSTAARLLTLKHFQDFLKKYVHKIKDELDRCKDVNLIFQSKSPDPVKLFRIWIRHGQKVTDLDPQKCTYMLKISEESGCPKNFYLSELLYTIVEH